MKKSLQAIVLGILWIFSPTVVSATPITISGPHSFVNPVTNATQVVNLSGLEWLHSSYTAGLSYQQVSAQMVAGGSFEGWRYATRSEFEILFDSLWGGVAERWHISNAAGADWMSANFGSLVDAATHFGSGGGVLYFGASTDCGGPGTFCMGQWRDSLESSPPSGDPVGSAWFSNDYGLSFGTGGTNTNRIEPITFTDISFPLSDASALVRVPEPGTLAILSLGLAGLGAMRRRIRNTVGNSS